MEERKRIFIIYTYRYITTYVSFRSRSGIVSIFLMKRACAFVYDHELISFLPYPHYPSAVWSSCRHSLSFFFPLNGCHTSWNCRVLSYNRASPQESYDGSPLRDIRCRRSCHRFFSFSSWASFFWLMDLSTCHIALSSSTSSSGILSDSASTLPVSWESNIFSSSPTLTAPLDGCASGFPVSACVVGGEDGSSDGYTRSRAAKGAGWRMFLSTRNCTCRPPAKARQCDQALKTR